MPGFLSSFLFHGKSLRHSSRSLSPAAIFIPMLHYKTEQVGRRHLKKLVTTTNLTSFSNKFGCHLLLSHKFHHKNLVFSPFSIHIVLGLIASGCKPQTNVTPLTYFLGTDTSSLCRLHSKIIPWISYDASEGGGPRIYFGNGVWIEKTISLNPSFQKILSLVYKEATCNYVDFQNKADHIADIVNLWAAKETNGVISELLDYAIENIAWLFFTNIIYFKGQWMRCFEPSNTRISKFHLFDGKKINVPYMTSSKDQFVCQFNHFKVLRLPYLQGEDTRDFSMYLILPNTKKSFDSMVMRIGSTPNFFEIHIPNKKVKVGRFMIPKFKISSKIVVDHILGDLGIRLPRMTEMVLERETLNRQEIVKENIFQKCFIEVNEQGTEAAASTVFEGMGCSPYPKDRVDFVADHPFVFVIREDVSGVILFMGQVSNPTL